jgi:hypothetical protein
MVATVVSKMLFTEIHVFFLSALTTIMKDLKEKFHILLALYYI